MLKEHADVVVVGAGGGGAVLGLALAQKGVDVMVLEQSPGPPCGVRGEILQPNGQHILDQLGVLNDLPASACRPVRYFHFHRAGGGRLCTIDYAMLPGPYNRALVTLPHAAHHVILQALETQAPGRLRYRTTFQSLLWNGNTVAGVRVDHAGTPMEISSQLVVGADGGLSTVRAALNIPTDVHRYAQAYVIGMIQAAQDLGDARYFVGKQTILGVFPAADQRVYVFSMIPAGSMEQVKAKGIEAFKATLKAIDPQSASTFDRLTGWEQTAYMPVGRVRARHWVVDGAALIGDAAHAMNPHASQGRMQAMVDAMTLAEVVADCLQGEGCTAKALSAYERRRRPHVEMLQQLADEQVLFWNTGNPVLAFFRDRVFRTLDRNPRLRYQVLATTAGFRTQKPFSLLDRLIAAGIIPDFQADRLPPDAMAERS